jgi:hypothetical protein
MWSRQAFGPSLSYTMGPMTTVADFLNMLRRSPSGPERHRADVLPRQRFPANRHALRPKRDQFPCHRLHRRNCQLLVMSLDPRKRMTDGISPPLTYLPYVCCLHAWRKESATQPRSTPFRPDSAQAADGCGYGRLGPLSSTIASSPNWNEITDSIASIVDSLTGPNNSIRFRTEI